MRADQFSLDFHHEPPRCTRCAKDLIGPYVRVNHWIYGDPAWARPHHRNGLCGTCHQIALDTLSDPEHEWRLDLHD